MREAPRVKADMAETKDLKLWLELKTNGMHNTFACVPYHNTLKNPQELSHEKLNK